MNNVIYITYDINMRNFLTERGIRYLILGQAPNPPHKTFYVYDKTTEEFKKALKDWFDKKTS